MFGVIPKIEKQLPLAKKPIEKDDVKSLGYLFSIKKSGPADRLKSNELFMYLFAVGMIGCIVIMLIEVYTGYIDMFLTTSLWAVLFVTAFVLYRRGYKGMSYHGLMVSVNLLNLYMVVIGGYNFQAIYSIYVGALVFTFIYFKKISTLWIYLIVSVLTQLVILYYNSDANINGIDQGLVIDGICVLSVNIAVFLMCYFYLTNLERARMNLDLAAADLNTQKEELRERSNELSRYIASNIQLENYTHLAAHELKAPLKAVKGFADLLKQKIDQKLDSKEKEMFNFISDKTDKMNVLLNDLASLGKVSQSSLTTDLINLDDLFKEIMIDRSDQLKSRKVILDFELKVEHMVGQLGLIKQLFSNLIGNAVKFVDPIKRPKIRVTVDKVGDDLIFKVMDNGIGIKEEYRHKIFQIFERLHSESEYQGSGIGLSICKKIVDLHNGMITIEDCELGGTCFVVRMPILEL